MSSKTKSTKECGRKITSAAQARVQQSTTKFYGVAKRVQHHTTSRKTKKCCILQHLFSEKFDRDQTSHNKIQHDKTRYNKVAKRVQHFIKHQSCMMLYEMLYSFGRGLKLSTKNCRGAFYYWDDFAIYPLEEFLKKKTRKATGFDLMCKD